MSEKEFSAVDLRNQENVVQIDSLTKDFGKGKGVFDVSLVLRRNEFLAVMGESGAGKSTLMRLLMSFVFPDCGKISVFGKDAIKERPFLSTRIAYVPGEISFPDLPSGKAFLKEQMALLGIPCEEKANSLIRRFQLDVTARPRSMSKGMKEKLALVAALMPDRPLLLLDEPTNGLDPLMREVFLRQMAEEKKEGKSLLLVSNDYEEVETLCDRAVLLEKGHIADIVDIRSLRNDRSTVYTIAFKRLPEDWPAVERKETAAKDGSPVFQVSVPRTKTGTFLEWLSRQSVSYVYEKESGLRDYFSKKEEHA